MRQNGGIEEVKWAIKKLSKTHARHINNYDANFGLDNQRRLTGMIKYFNVLIAYKFTLFYITINNYKHIVKMYINVWP